MIPRRSFLTLSAVCLVCASSMPVPPAWAQSPGKTARILVGFAAGGSTDILARVLADKLRGQYASTVIVDNKPGAGGRLAVEALKGGAGDGSVMVLTPPGVMVINPHIYKDLPYDPLRDFAPVTPVGQYPFVIGIGPRVPAKITTLADFLQWCKENPIAAAYGSPGPGTPPHFTGAMLSRAAGVELTHVPYKGMAPLMQELIGGQIASGILAIGDAVPHVNDGKLRFLAMTGSTRSRFLPDTPAVGEVGFKELEYQEWFGVFVPATTPPDVVERLASLIRGALQTPEVQERFRHLGIEVATSTPAQFKAVVKSDYDKWGAIIKSTGFSLER